MITKRPLYLIRCTGVRGFPVWASTRLRAWYMTPVDALMAARGENDKRSRDVWLTTEYAPDIALLGRLRSEGWAVNVLADEEITA